MCQAQCRSSEKLEDLPKIIKPGGRGINIYVRSGWHWDLRCLPLNVHPQKLENKPSNWKHWTSLTALAYVADPHFHWGIQPKNLVTFYKHFFHHTLAEEAHVDYKYGLLPLYCRLSQCSFNGPSVCSCTEVQCNMEILKKNKQNPAPTCTLLFGGWDCGAYTATDVAGALVYRGMLPR